MIEEGRILLEAAVVALELPNPDIEAIRDLSARRMSFWLKLALERQLSYEPLPQG